MARIRSIYPNTPTDPEFATLPVEARLMFIYSWTMADDAGNLEGNPLGLKMALFPADDWASVARITELVAALVAGQFYEPYESGGKQYLHIRTFHKYQKPERKTKPRCPLYPGQEYEYKVRQGKEWIPVTETGAFGEHTPNAQCANSVQSLGSVVECSGQKTLDENVNESLTENATAGSTPRRDTPAPDAFGVNGTSNTPRLEPVAATADCTAIEAAIQTALKEMVPAPAADGRPHQRPNVIFMKTRRFDDDDG